LFPGNSIVVRAVQEDSAAEREDQYRDLVYIGLTRGTIEEDRNAADDMISLGSGSSADGDGITVTSNDLRAADDVISLGSEPIDNEDGVTDTSNDCAISDTEGTPFPAFKAPPP
jgi:hypothetical protein